MTDEQLGDISLLLRQLGRSSTPDVPNSDFGVTALGLIFDGGVPPTVEVLTVAPDDLVASLGQHAAVGVGVPGLLAEQASSPSVVYLIIAEAAFYCGPWVGASSGGHRNLAEDIFEAGRIVRSRGGAVLFIPSSQRGFDGARERIRSTTTVDITQVPEEDLEENASQTAIWRACSDYALGITE